MILKVSPYLIPFLSVSSTVVCCVGHTFMVGSQISPADGSRSTKKLINYDKVLVAIDQFDDCR